MSFSFFKQKSTNPVDLIRANQDHKSAIAETELAKDNVKDNAVRSGNPDYDVLDDALRKMDLKLELHQRAQVEIRVRLESIIRQQLLDAKAELERRRPALEREILEQYQQCGALFQQFLDLMQILPASFSGIARYLSETVDDSLQGNAKTPEKEAFLAGMQSVDPPQRDYRTEWQAVQPRTGADPQGLERKVQKTVARMLGEINQHEGQPGAFGLGPR